jgi:hypothetical protein
VRRCPAPILIVGTERSGSNLLRLLLNTHSSVTVPHPPHIMAHFARLEPLYGDLARPSKFERLADDVARHVRGHIHPWPTPPDRERLIREAEPRDLLGLYFALYDQHLEATGKQVWGCKSTFMIHCAERVLAHRPGARFLWLVRDPRDVAVSSRDSVFNPYHPYYTSRLWAEQQSLGLALIRRHGERNVHRVGYEDLITEPSATLMRICDFLDVAYEPAMLDYIRTPDAALTAGLAQDWRNTNRPILSHNRNKFVTGLSADEIQAVESAAGELMAALGYAPVSGGGGAKPHQRAVAYRLRNEWIRLRTEWRSLLQSRNHWRRWQRTLRMKLLFLRLRLGVR